MNFRHLFSCGIDEYDVHLLSYFFFSDEQQNIISFTAHGPPYYQERYQLV